MSEHTARIEWERDTPDFDYDTFTRDHRIHFSDSVSLQASSAADYSGTASYADPEQQLAGAVSSCHMLTFLALATVLTLVQVPVMYSLSESFAAVFRRFAPGDE